MIIVGILIILFVIFFVLKRHIGPAHLAMIAGVSVYEAFGTDIVNFAHNIFNAAPTELLKVIIFLILVLVLPLLLYFQSGRGGLFGLLRIIEALIFSALLVSLCAWCLEYFVAFDELSKTILDTINSVKGPILAAGVLVAYFDIIVYRESY